MNKFLMICYVAARFSAGENVFEITNNMRGNFVEAPGWVRDTLLFKWLLNDGSIKVADEQISKKKGENDPMDGISAEGKDQAVSEANEKEATTGEKPKARKTAKKGDA